MIAEDFALRGAASRRRRAFHDPSGFWSLGQPKPWRIMKKARPG